MPTLIRFDSVGELAEYQRELNRPMFVGVLTLDPCNAKSCKPEVEKTDKAEPVPSDGRLPFKDTPNVAHEALLELRKKYKTAEIAKRFGVAKGTVNLWARTGNIKDANANKILELAKK